MKRRNFFAVLGAGFAVTGLFYQNIRNYFYGLTGKAQDKNELVSKLVMCAQSIYPDAQSLGIENFFRQSLNTPFYKKKAQELEPILTYLDKEAERISNKLFTELTPVQQDKLVQHCATASLTLEQQSAFNTLVDITLQGCFSSPDHGGNKNYHSWNIMKDHLQRNWFNV